MKRIGESGSPSRTPRLTLKEGLKETIVNYAARYILIRRLNPRYKGDTKTKWLKYKKGEHLQPLMEL